MIPTVEDILLDLAAGKISVEQASAWMEEHFTLAMEQAISEARPEVRVREMPNPPPSMNYLESEAWKLGWYNGAYGHDPK